MFSINASLIDNAMIICAIIYNLCIIMIFIARAHEHYKLEEGIGVVVSLLIVPFLILWLLNLVKGRDSAHLITGFPIILFLLDDLWYRAIQKKKARHKIHHDNCTSYSACFHVDNNRSSLPVRPLSCNKLFPQS